MQKCYKASCQWDPRCMRIARSFAPGDVSIEKIYSARDVSANGRPRRLAENLTPGRSADQVDEKSKRAGHAVGNLPEESDAGVDVHAFAVVRINEAAVEIRFAGIVHREKRGVLGIELRPVVEPALLNPAVEIILGRSEERRVGKECSSRWSPDQCTR